MNGVSFDVKQSRQIKKMRTRKKKKEKRSPVPSSFFLNFLLITLIKVNDI